MKIQTVVHNLDRHVETVERENGIWRIVIDTRYPKDAPRYFTQKVFVLVGTTELESSFNTDTKFESFGAALMEARDAVRYYDASDQPAGDFIPAYRELIVTTHASQRDGRSLRKVSVDGVDTGLYLEKMETSNAGTFWYVVAFYPDFDPEDTGNYQSSGYESRAAALDRIVSDHINGNWTENFTRGYAA